MYIEPASRQIKNIRYQKIVYLLASAVIIILKIVNISLSEWFKYCWWDFGLLDGSTFTSFKNFENESSISDVENDSCGSLKPLVLEYCPDFCDYVTNFNDAGLSMVFFSILSIITEMLCLAFHVWNYFKHSFRFKKIWVIIVIPKVLFALGFIVWYGVIKPNKIKKVNGQQSVDFTLEAGFYIAIVVIIYDILLMLFGLLKTRKEFLVKKQAWTRDFHS